MAYGEQAVEMALLILNQEINKLQGVRKVTVVHTLAVLMVNVMCWDLFMSFFLFISNFGVFRLYLYCQKLWRLTQHPWFSGLCICSFIMEFSSQMKRMTCSFLRYVFLCFLLLCGVCSGECFFFLIWRMGNFLEYRDSTS